MNAPTVQEQRAYPRSVLQALDQLSKDVSDIAHTEIIGEVTHASARFPIRAISFGPKDNLKAPVFALFGGVHGLERIGSEVVLAYLRTFSQYARWDESTKRMLKEIRVIFVPVINPVGILLNRRSNGNGVDLMRNAPVDSKEPVSRFLIFRGHRISPRLPWYRGEKGAQLETETQALVDFVQKKIFPSELAFCVDVHSGFGAVDRFWYPFATSKESFPLTPEILRLKQLLDTTLPNHVYQIEPQASQYTTHGDLWDYLYFLHEKSPNAGRYFFPFTLEMGSWNWLKKNFLSGLKLQAIFHPIKQHRIRRVLRRHAQLFDFLGKAAHNPSAWL